MESESFSDMMPIEESINSSMTDLVTIFDTNDIDKVIALAEAQSEKSLYHIALWAKMSMLKAALTMDAKDLVSAKKATKKCLKLCNKLRKKKFKKITNMLTKKNYGDFYSDLELHAELTYAMVTGCKSVLALMNCTSIKKLTRIAYHIGICVNIIAKCREIFEKRTSWESNVSKENFEAAIRLERGIRNLIVSFLPPKLLKIVNFLGFKGIREVAFNELNKAIELPGIYGLIGEMVVILYWLYIEMHGCLGPTNVDAMRTLIDKKMAQYPNSVLYKVAKNKLTQITGNIQESTEGFLSIIDKEFEMFHKISHWELMWTNAVLGEWDECIKYAQLLREKTLHSPAIITYLEAVFRYAKGKLQNDPKQIDQATTLFETVPTLRIRYLGKTMTLEKAVIVQSQRFFKNGKTLIAPVQESMYNINYIYLLTGNDAIAQKWFNLTEAELNEYAKDQADREKYLCVLFYKGVILKHLGKFNEAIDCFNTIMNEEKVFVKEKSIVPQAHMEIGMVKMLEGKKDEAKEILESVIQTYSKYVSENIVHIRSYAALRALGVSTDKTVEVEGEDLENLDGIDEESSSSDED
ncbi:Tetratricopeptide repeat protein 39B [Sarcoptes scabiei]|uniref:Tetratricopeptide repeat protein 39B n=1 Tax=Sarcoptes scabiei TaxID=52283 RepID=A0A834VB79_SARSC|nr:Tetratricopeptide repeat protein 39B [Sarcoptes scabiei]